MMQFTDEVGHMHEGGHLHVLHFEMREAHESSCSGKRPRKLPMNRSHGGALCDGKCALQVRLDLVACAGNAFEESNAMKERWSECTMRKDDTSQLTQNVAVRIA